MQDLQKDVKFEEEMQVFRDLQKKANVDDGTDYRLDDTRVKMLDFQCEYKGKEVATVSDIYRLINIIMSMHIVLCRQQEEILSLSQDVSLIKFEMDK